MPNVLSHRAALTTASLLMAALMAGTARAAALTWDPGAVNGGGVIDDGGGVWTAANAWNTGAGNVTWSSANTATFTGTVGGTVSSPTSISTQGITVNGSADYNISAVLLGTGGLVKNGTGTLTLSANNSIATGYTGQTQVNQGIVKLGNAGGLGRTGAGNETVVSAGATVDFNGFASSESFIISGAGVGGNGAFISSGAGGGGAFASGTVTLAGSTTLGGNNLNITGVVSGAAGSTLTKTGTGQLNLSGANTYSGDTVISQGSLRLSGSLGSGNYAGTITIAGGANFTHFSPTNQTLTGLVTGAGSLIKSAGTGVLTLNNNLNDYTGATIITNGGAGGFDANGVALNSVLAVTSIGDGTATSAIGKSANVASNLVLDGGVLRYVGAGETTARNFTLNRKFANASGLDASGTGAVTFTGAMTLGTQGARTLTLTGTSTADNTLATVIHNDAGNNATSIVKHGAGTWVMSGNNAYTGGTTITYGILKAGITANAFGVRGAMTFNNDATHGATLDLNNFDTTLGSLSGGGANSTVALGGKNLTLSTDSLTYTYAGNITGTGAGNLIKEGLGTQVLTSAASSYTGQTRINQGTLQVGNLGGTAANGALGRSTVVFGNVGADTGTLRYAGASATSDHAMVFNSAGAVDVSNAATNLTLTGSLTGAAGLVKRGAGTLTLRQSVGYTGATTVDGGILAIDYTGGASGNILSSQLNMKSGVLQVKGTAGSQTQSFTTVQSLGTALMQLNQNGSTDLQVHIDNMVRGGQGRLNFSGLTFDANGQPTVGSRVSIDQLDGASVGPSGLNLEGKKTGNWSMINGTGWAAFDDNSTAGGGGPGPSGSAPGKYYIALAQFQQIYTGTTGGKSVVIPNDPVSSGGFPDISINENGSFGAPVRLEAATTTVDSIMMLANTTATAINMDIVGATGTANANSKLVMGTDATGFNGGAIAVGTGAQSLTIGGGANGTGLSGIITGTAGANSRITFINNNDASSGGAILTINASIQDNGPRQVSVEVSGGENPGTTVFNNINTYTGDTRINGRGTLRLTNGGTISGGDLAIDTAATLEINNNVNATIGSAPGATLTGAGNLLVNHTAGNLVTTLTADAGGFTGIAKMQTGTLDLNDAGGIGAGTLTFTGGTLRFEAPAASASYANVFVSNGTAAMNFDTNGQTVNFAGTFDGTNTGTLNKLGTGTFNITGSNVLTAAKGNNIVVANGTLGVGAAATLNGGSYDGTIALTQTTSTFDYFSSSNQTLTGIISGAGNVSLRGSGTIFLNAASSYTGTTFVQNGLATAGTSSGATAFGNNSAVTVNSNGTVDLNSTSQTIGSLSDGGFGDATGTITNNGATAASTLTISGVNGSPVSYAGAIADGTSFALGLTKNGAGKQILAGNNTYTRQTTVNNGILQIENDNALGTAAAGTTVNTGGTLALDGGVAVAAESLTLSGNGFGGGGALRSTSGSNTYGGDITLAAAARINSDAGSTLLITGNITGTNALTVGGAGNTRIDSVVTTAVTSLTKDGTGTLTLTAANTYTGATNVNGGTLALNLTADNVINAGNTVNFNGGTLDFTGGSSTAKQVFGTTNVAGGASRITKSNYNGLTGVSATAGVNLGNIVMSGGTLDIDGLAVHSIAGNDDSWIKASGAPVSKRYIGSGAITANGGTDLVGTNTLGNLIIAVTNPYRRGATAFSDTPTKVAKFIEPPTGDFGALGVDNGSGETTITLDTGTQTLGPAGHSYWSGMLNAYSSGTTILDLQTNTLHLDQDGAVAANAGSDLVINNGHLTAGGTTSGTAGTLTFSGAKNITVGSVIQNNGVGAVGLVVNGPGTTLLTGANTYTGDTVVQGGLLRVDGTHNAGSGNYVVTGGTLGGHGTITTTGTVTVAAAGQITAGALGSLSANDSDNILHINAGTLSLSGTYVADINYNGELGTQTDGDLADLISVTGDVDFTGAKLDLSGINNAGPVGSHYAVKLFEWTGSDGGTATGDWNAANITGLEAGQSVVRWGNAYYLVPEPASFALLGMGSLLLMLRRPSRRRRRSAHLLMKRAEA